MQSKFLRVLPAATSCIAAFAFLIATDRPAHAYVDPGAGLLMLQSAGAAVVGAALIMRRKLTGLLKGKEALPPLTKAKAESGAE